MYPHAYILNAIFTTFYSAFDIYRILSKKDFSKDRNDFYTFDTYTILYISVTQRL